MSLLYRGWAGPLHSFIDSAATKTEGQGEWNARKRGCRKIHIGIDEEA